MSTVRLKWKNPIPTASQRPIARTVISTRVAESMPWAVLVSVEAPLEEASDDELVDGTYYYMAEWYDIGGQASAPLYAQATVGGVVPPPSAWDPPSPGGFFEAIVEP